MDTNSKQFQDALQNLTSAFFQFLDTVNPGGTDREANIRFIAQSLQALSANMGALSGAPISSTQGIEPEASQSTHVTATPSPVESIVQPTIPNNQI